AARDRHGREPAEAGGGAAVVPLRWPEQASRARDAIDAERRRRREQAVPQRPAPPGSLGDRLRATSMLAIPEDDEEWPRTPRKQSTRRAAPYRSCRGRCPTGKPGKAGPGGG